MILLLKIAVFLFYISKLDHQYSWPSWKSGRARSGPGAPWSTARRYLLLSTTHHSKRHLPFCHNTFSREADWHTDRQVG